MKTRYITFRGTALIDCTTTPVIGSEFETTLQGGYGMQIDTRNIYTDDFSDAERRAIDKSTADTLVIYSGGMLEAKDFRAFIDELENQLEPDNFSIYWSYSTQASSIHRVGSLVV